MADDEKKDKRPWFLKKTNWGLIIYAIGEGAALCGTVYPPAVPASPILKAIGGILAGFGIADRVSKK